MKSYSDKLKNELIKYMVAKVLGLYFVYFRRKGTYSMLKDLIGHLRSQELTHQHILGLLDIYIIGTEFLSILTSALRQPSLQRVRRRIEDRRVIGKIIWKETITNLSRGLSPIQEIITYSRYSPENLLLIKTYIKLTSLLEKKIAEIKSELTTSDKSMNKFILNYIRQNYLERIYDDIKRKLRSSYLRGLLNDAFSNRISTREILRDIRKLPWIPPWAKELITTYQKIESVSYANISTSKLSKSNISDKLYELYNLYILTEAAEKIGWKVDIEFTGRTNHKLYIRLRPGNRAIYRIYYQKEFRQGSSSTIVIRPDMTIMDNRGNVIAVVDAKFSDSDRYIKKSRIKLITYLALTNARIAALIHLPKRLGIETKESFKSIIEDTVMTEKITICKDRKAELVELSILPQKNDDNNIEKINLLLTRVAKYK